MVWKLIVVFAKYIIVNQVVDRKILSKNGLMLFQKSFITSKYSQGSYTITFKIAANGTAIIIPKIFRAYPPIRTTIITNIG